MKQINISKRVISNPVFTTFDKKLKLSDTVVLYNDGMFWKAIPYDIMLEYPVIHDSYEGSPITIYVCPFTLFSCVYFGEYMPTDKTYEDNLVISSKNNVLVPILNRVYDANMENIVDLFIRKNEVKIMSLRNAISMYPDIKFIDTSEIKRAEPIKTKYNQISYIIEYYSKKNNVDKYKYTIIIPKYNVFDTVKNKFDSYFTKMIDMIRDKGCHIYPCYLEAFEKTHNKYKKINL